jgi:hypothetical protein
MARHDSPRSSIARMVSAKGRRAAELQKLRAELANQLDRLDFRSESIGPALAKIAQHAERTIRRLAVSSESSAASMQTAGRSSPIKSMPFWRVPASITGWRR